MKFNNNFLYACIFTTSFVMFEGHAPLNGQNQEIKSPINFNQIERSDNVEKDKTDRIDTVSSIVNRYSKLVDKGSNHSKISRNQNDTLLKQARVLAAQKKKIDSLLAIKERQLRETGIDYSEYDDSSRKEEKVKSHRWRIFRIFDKK